MKGAEGDQGVIGPAGEKGEQGIQGEQGPAGASGAKGATGSKGSTGATGSQGIPGEAGVPFHGQGSFTITDGTYTTEMVNQENGIISASLVGVWVEGATVSYSAFTATGTGGLYVVEEPTWGTTATVFINGIFSADGVSFLGMALWTKDNPITNDEVTAIVGTITIQLDGSFEVTLTGAAEVPGFGSMPCTIDITGSILTSSGG
ncbi:hypothetical protein ES708_32715 [subsurface metagenome]